MAFHYNKTPLFGEFNVHIHSVRFHKVDETKWEALWDEMVREYHYLGYEGVIGSRVKYIITLGRQIIGAISFCSAAYKLGPRDAFVGWSEEVRLSKLQHMVTNNRFLILPWIRLRNLASHILSKSLIQLREDWEKQYGVTLYMVETFVDREKYLGTCYAAANWIYLGMTKGYGRQRNTFVYHGQKKDIYVYIMDRAFAREFHPDIKRLQNGREELEEMVCGIPIWFSTILKKLGIGVDVIDRVRECFATHVERYLDYLGRKEHRNHFAAMLKGLLSDLERKSIEPIAIAYEGSDNVRNLSFFMSESKWNDGGMLGEYRREASALLGDEDGMTTLDGTDFPKKGNNSVGVARQYCGRLGKVDNCQASVMTGYVSKHGYCLTDYELYMPESWFDDAHAERYKQCGAPKNLRFRTKNEIARNMIQRNSESGLFPAKYVGADCSFGSDSKFLDSLPEGLIYFVDVPCDCRVFANRPELAVPPYSGRGRKPVKETTSFPPRTVKDIAEDESLPWNDVVLGIGAKGPVITNDKYVRVVEVRDGKPGKDVWLYVRKLADGTIKYALCNESAEASPEDLRKPALMRWSIEQCFHECKEYIGMDHYETRSWDGWRRHILLCLIAHLFVIKLRMEFSCKAQSPGSSPYTDVPVPLDDYLKAAESMLIHEEIQHPNITAVPKRPQQVLTIGLVRMLIIASFQKLGSLLKNLDYYLYKTAQAFNSHSKSAVEKAFLTHYGHVPLYG